MLSGTYTLFDTFQVRGHWALPGHEANAIPGILSFSPRELILDLFGTFHDLSWQELSILPKTARRADVVLGVLDDGTNCTLCGNVEATRHTHSGGRTRSTLSGRLLLLGGHASSREPEFPSIAVSFTGLEAWLLHDVFTGKYRRTETGELLGLDVSYAVPSTFQAEIPSLGLTVSSDSMLLQRPALASHSLDHVAQFKLLPAATRPVVWYLDVITDLANLLTLLSESPVCPRIIAASLIVEGTKGDDPDEETFADRTADCFFPHLRVMPPSVHAFMMLFTFADVRDRLADVLTTWLTMGPFMRTAKSLFFSTIHTPSPFVDARFLSLAQALECYSRGTSSACYVSTDEYGKIEQAVTEAIPTGVPKPLRDALKSRIKYGNEFSLRKRIRELLDGLESPTIDLLCTDTDDFIAGIVASRNYLTHYSEETEEDALHGSDLYWAAEKLKMLLRVLFLKRLGFDETAIRARVHAHPTLSQFITRWRDAPERGSSSSTS